MFKRLITLFISVLLTSSLVACTTDDVGITETDAPDESTPTPYEEELEIDTSPVEDGYLRGGELKIMSFNLDADETTIAERADGLSSIILSNAPDSIGVQESRGSWNTLLKEKLGDNYYRVGVAADGAQASMSSFATYIYYNSKKYTEIDSGTFWLSRTPSEPSIYSDTVDCNRTCTWVILQSKISGFKYVHMNSHLDWMDSEATKYQIALIRDQIKVFEDMGLPVFATGDYNTDEGSVAYNIMLEAESIADSKHVAERTMSLGTYPDYGANDTTKEPPIDFCFVTKEKMDVLEYKVLEEKPGGKYVSDHNALLIHAKLKSLPDTFATAERPDLSDVQVTSKISNGTLSFSFNSSENESESPIVRYTVKVKNEKGKTLLNKKISSEYMNYEPPKEFSFEVEEIEEGAEYTVIITAVNLYGLVSDEVTFKV